MLKTIRFKSGPTRDAELTSIDPGPMTILVGPNNAGKSLTLRELQQSLAKGRTDWADSTWRIIADIEPELPGEGATRREIEQAVESDFAPFRSLVLEDNGLEFLFSLAAGSRAIADIPPQVLDTVKHVVMLLSKRKVAERLERAGKLHAQSTVQSEEAAPAAPQIELTNFDEIIRQKLDEVVTLLKQYYNGLLCVIKNVHEHTPAALIARGIVNLRGYFEHIQGPVAFLDGKTRLSLIQTERTVSLRSSSSSRGGMLMALRNDRPRMERLRSYILDAFGLHAALDILDLQELKLVLSEIPLPEGVEDRIDDQARAFFGQTSDLTEFSDGVRTYIGLHAQLLSESCNYAMIDEPEAFLHPPLARRLGANLTSLAAERKTYVFAATHSPDFLMGCLSTGHPVNIVRLGYKHGQGSSRVLDPARLTEMMQDPLLRSTGTLSALFHSAAIVCEGAKDRAFYGEINDRLVRFLPAYPRLMQSCQFIDTNGKQAIWRVFSYLRAMGIPTACVIDLDILKGDSNGKDVLSPILASIGVAKEAISSLCQMRANVAKIFDNRKDLFKSGGLRGLNAADTDAVQLFMDAVERYGIFVVGCGQLENWLPHLDITVNKSDWLPAMFERMGPLEGGLKPEEGDVWDFIRRIATWLDLADAN